MASHYSRRVALAPLLTAGALGCNSPLWVYDGVEIAGELAGSTCRFTVSHRPGARDTVLVGRRLHVGMNGVINIGLSAGQGLKTISCHELQLSIVSPTDSLPTPGEYEVTEQLGHPRGTVSAALFAPVVTAGRWPFAMTGVYLTGQEGVVQLDSMSRHLVWGRFHFRARREAHGE